MARALPWALGAAAIVLANWAIWRQPAVRPAPLEVVHLDVGFPPQVEPVAGRQGGIAISPDGKAIAMVGFTKGVRRLFVRRLDTPEAIDAGDTSGAGVFSPDGSEVALIRNSRVLTRISLSDGRSVGLAGGADFVTGATLAWGGDEIVFARGGSLWSVPAAGGEARELTKLAPPEGVLHTDPLVLPGGRTVLFSCLRGAPATGRIEAVPLAGGQRSVVLEGAMSPVWSPTGHLLFGREGAVWVVPFDPVQARALGPAVRVIPPGVVRLRAGGVGFQLSSNGTLLFVPASFDDKRLVSVARDGSELPLALPPGSYGNPRISPDGRRVAVEAGGSAIEVIDLVRGTRATAFPGAPGTAFPMWTSDGSRLVFRRFGLFWVAADGSGKTGFIAGGDVGSSAASAGPDARSFIAIHIRPETAGDLYLMSVDGAFPPKALVATPAYEGSPHLSPDGRWLAYQSNESGQPEIYVRRYPELDRAWPVSEGGGVQVRWSPSGREVFYRGATGRIMAVAFDDNGAEPALGRPTALFEDVYDFGQGISIPNYDVTREGRFLMLRRGSQVGILKVVLNWTEELKRTLARRGTQ